MPGLRSLVARRRCSLPSTQISSDPIICTYPSVPGSISSRKGHSLDEIHPNEKTSLKDGKSKWDLKTLFEVKEEPFSPTKQDVNISSEKIFYSSNMPSVNEINLNGFEKENNHAVAQCQNDFFDPLELPLKQEIKSEPLSDEENGFDNGNIELSKNVSPERIVIKMKLLHGSSLSDVTNISPDSSSDGNESVKSEFNYERNCSPNTHWTIDSILNQPFVESEYLECNNSNNYTETIQMPNQDVNCKPDNEKLNCTNENESFIAPISYENANDNADSKTLNSIADPDNNNIALQENEKNLEKIPKRSDIKFIENVRRPSDSSEVSEDSVCSEASIGSSLSSSDSSVKSCSIVIKRLENSDTYSCFRSPKSKRKKRQETEFTKTVYFNGKSSLPVLYIQKRLLYDSESDMLPCSVTLCDIFSNYPFRKENCPRCCRCYNLESDVYVDVCCNTLTFQCLTCKWLVVRNIKSKEIDFNVQPQNCK